MPEAIEEVREETGVAARRFHTVVNRAREMADEEGVKLHAHVLAGHPVRDIVDLARDLKADLLVVGGSGHSALYGRLMADIGQASLVGSIPKRSIIVLPARRQQGACSINYAVTSFRFGG